jgi:ferredoxin-NADP reductase
MEEYIVKVLSIEPVTHDVKRFRFEKPDGYVFKPGQATDVSINTPGLKNEKRPFTFTCLNSVDYLEFTIKIYTDHPGITNELGKIKPGAELIIRDVWGDIAYKGSGVFIAGGAGITPFLAILRDLESRNALLNNILIFANKTKKDIILENELSQLLGKSFINILSGEKVAGYEHGFITREFLQTHLPANTKNFYLCGPPPMMAAILSQLENLGVPGSMIIMEPM